MRRKYLQILYTCLMYLIMLNYNHLYYFWKVAKIGSLSGAAQDLSLSQPAMSLQIKTLEESMGIALFERRNRKLILTQEGQAVFAKCDDMFHVSSQIQTMIESHQFLANKRLLNIGATSTLSKNFQFLFSRVARDIPDFSPAPT